MFVCMAGMQECCSWNLGTSSCLYVYLWFTSVLISMLPGSSYLSRFGLKPPPHPCFEVPEPRSEVWVSRPLVKKKF